MTEAAYKDFNPCLQFQGVTAGRRHGWELAEGRRGTGAEAESLHPDPQARAERANWNTWAF